MIPTRASFRIFVQSKLALVVIIPTQILFLFTDNEGPEVTAESPGRGCAVFFRLIQPSVLPSLFAKSERIRSLLLFYRATDFILKFIDLSRICLREKAKLLSD